MRVPIYFLLVCCFRRSHPASAGSSAASSFLVRFDSMPIYRYPSILSHLRIDGTDVRECEISMPF